MLSGTGAIYEFCNNIGTLLPFAPAHLTAALKPNADVERTLTAPVLLTLFGHKTSHRSRSQSPHPWNRARH